MRGPFDDEEMEPVKPRRDRELTLGSGALLAMFSGLLLLCVLCFGLGYSVGRRASPSPSAASLPAASQPVAANDAAAKPPATPQSDQPPATDAGGAAPDTDDGQGSAAQVASNAQAATASEPSGAPPGPSQVHPAMAAGPATGNSDQGAQANGVRPALAPAGAAPAGSLMVQIAAVSQLEDANVLTDALRKRGYAVTARREPADNLIHVRIGPFATAAEANAWRLKLLNDGYNAVVQP